MFRSRAAEIQLKEAVEDLIVGHQIGPPICREDGVIELSMDLIEPGRPLVVENGQCALLEFRFFGSSRVEPSLAQVVEAVRNVSYRRALNLVG